LNSQELAVQDNLH